MAQWTAQVSSNLDDGWVRRSDSNFSDAQGIYAGDFDATLNDYESFIRFPNVTVPQGATITSAYLYITADGTVGTQPWLTKIYGNDVDNATAPTTFAGYDALVRTTAAVDWDPTVWTTATEYQSPDISSIIQEIVDRGSWASGNAMQLLWVGDDGAGNNGKRVAGHSHNVNPAEAPRLEINYNDGTYGKIIDLGAGQFIRVVT